MIQNDEGEEIEAEQYFETNRTIHFYDERHN